MLPPNPGSSSNPNSHPPSGSYIPTAYGAPPGQYYTSAPGGPARMGPYNPVPYYTPPYPSKTQPLSQPPQPVGNRGWALDKPDYDGVRRGKKRSLTGSDGGSGNGDGDNPEDMHGGGVRRENAEIRGGSQGMKEKEKERSKRIKTPRACDSCRRKKIRCDAVEGAEPPTCVHCKHHGFECTWFLPITETRFKRKREQEEAAAHAAAAALQPSKGAQPPAGFSITTALPPTMISAGKLGSGSLPTSGTPSSYAQPSSAAPSNGVDASPSSSERSSRERTRDARVFGPTSMSYLMHSTSSFPLERMGQYDSKHSQSLRVRGSGDGLITMITEEGNEGSQDEGEAKPGGTSQSSMLPGGSSSLVIPPQVAEQLVNHFFSNVAPLFPILTRQDLPSSTPLSPSVFYAICGVSSMNRVVAPAYRKAARDAVRDIHKQNELLAQSNLSSIQSLLLFSYSLEFERPKMGCATWTVLGAAIRMAQGMGLHREAPMEERPDDHAELRRRIWGGCIIADRWVAAMWGLPQMIDLNDCDRLFPSAHEVRPGIDVNIEKTPYAGNTALIELSILLGRVMKLFYSPTGILHATDEQAYGLEGDLNAWQEALPDEDESGSFTGVPTGYLRLLSVPVRFLLYRPFMRITYTCPESLTFPVAPDQFNEMLRAARAGIHWVDQHESTLEGFPSGLYATFICCLIQYHDHVRRRDPKSLTTLAVARDVLSRIACSECHVRGKVAEIVALLYTTAASVGKWLDQREVNPAVPPLNTPTRRPAPDPSRMTLL